jgi:hypothetical protein
MVASADVRMAFDVYDMSQNGGAEKFRLIVERRRTLRIPAPCDARVRGVDARGLAFEEDALIDNLSAGGLYLRLGRRVERGERLFIIFRLSAINRERALVTRVAVRGVVMRFEPQPDGSCGVGVALTNHRFL